MSEVVTEAVKVMNEKDTSGFDGTAKFDVEDEGCFMVDSSGAREGDEAEFVIVDRLAAETGQPVRRSMEADRTDDVRGARLEARGGGGVGRPVLKADPVDHRAAALIGRHML